MVTSLLDSRMSSVPRRWPFSSGMGILQRRECELDEESNGSERGAYENLLLKARKITQISLNSLRPKDGIKIGSAM